MQIIDPVAVVPATADLVAATAAAVATATGARLVHNNFPSLDAHLAGIRFWQFSLCQLLNERFSLIDW